MFASTDVNSPSPSLNLRPNNFDFWTIYQISTENEFWYGDCGYITGANVVKIYRIPVIPMGIVVLIPTAVLIFSTESQSPTKNRNNEM